MTDAGLVSKKPTPWQTIVSFLGKLEELFLCLLLTAMIVLACLQIFLRDVFAGGFLWADPLLRYLVLWAGMFGAAVATKRGKHIAIDIVSYLAPEAVKPWLEVVIDLFAALVCGWLTYAAFLFVKNEATFGGESDLLGIPAWGWNLVFPIAFAVMSLRFFLAALGTIAETSGLFRRPPGKAARLFRS